MIEILTVLIFIFALKAYFNNPNAGFVYVLQDPMSQRIKIGKTKNDVEFRALSIARTMQVEELHILMIIKTRNRHKLERELHARYKAFRLEPSYQGNGATEWFSDDILPDLLS